MLDRGVGTSLSADAALLLWCALASIGSFVLIFAIAALRLTNEIVLIRRAMIWIRLSFLVILILHSVQLGLYLDTPPRIILPHLGAVRPVLGFVLCFLGFFIASHPVFRWMVVLLQPLFLASFIYTAATLQVEIGCREAGTCIKQSGFTTSQLQVLLRTELALLFLEFWVILLAAYGIIAIGACSSRYPVRMFSITKPLSQLPPANSAANAHVQTTVAASEIVELQQVEELERRALLQPQEAAMMADEQGSYSANPYGPRESFMQATGGTGLLADDSDEPSARSSRPVQRRVR